MVLAGLGVAVDLATSWRDDTAKTKEAQLRTAIPTAKRERTECSRDTFYRSNTAIEKQPPTTPFASSNFIMKNSLFGSVRGGHLRRLVCQRLGNT
eukprot:scaffold1174_cov180-Amphora_coffeaeformis.AAC.4